MPRHDPYMRDRNVSSAAGLQIIAGLGLSPDDTTINGAVHAEADWFDGNATQNFWRDAENLAVNPTSGGDRWAVSQAAPYRRIHLKGDLQLDDGGWSSGGLLADTKIDGTVNSANWFSTYAEKNRSRVGTQRTSSSTPCASVLDTSAPSVGSSGSVTSVRVWR